MLRNLDVEEAGLLAALGWRIWRERNSVCLEGKSTSPSRAVSDARCFVVEWLATRLPLRFAVVRDRSYPNWQRPAPGSVKINTDAALFSEIQLTGFGMLIRGDQGEFIAARSKFLPGVLCVDEAEIIEVHEALSWIKAHGYNFIEVETDSKGIICN